MSKHSWPRCGLDYCMNSSRRFYKVFQTGPYCSPMDRIRLVPLDAYCLLLQGVPSF